MKIGLEKNDALGGRSEPPTLGMNMRIEARLYKLTTYTAHMMERLQNDFLMNRRDMGIRRTRRNRRDLLDQAAFPCPHLSLIKSWGVLQRF